MSEVIVTSTYLGTYAPALVHVPSQVGRQTWNFIGESFHFEIQPPSNDRTYLVLGLWATSQTKRLSDSSYSESILNVKLRIIKRQQTKY